VLSLNAVSRDLIGKMRHFGSFSSPGIDRVDLRHQLCIANGAFSSNRWLHETFQRRLIMATAIAKTEPRRLRPWFRRGPLENIREEMQDLISRTFGEEGDLWSTDRITPSLDLSETESAVEVSMDIPGMEAKDIDIQVNANVLTVSGERKEEREEKGKTYHRVERRVGAFSRSVTLPCPVKEEAVDAQYKNGILTIKLPKTEESKARKITVKS
jgi:HSP20 family protein